MELWMTYGKNRQQVCGVDENTTLKELAEKVEKLTGLKSELQKIIWRGKVLGPDNRTLREVGMSETSYTNVLVVGATEKSVEKIREVHSDSAMRPFEENVPARRKYEAKITSSRMRSKYTFLRTETIKGLHDEDKAAELLRQICEDRGIAAVMERHQWMVGNLKEMYPDGKVGVDPVCVLGLNVNKGAEIQIRLRTDDMKGFRPFYKLREVIFHELSHNVHSSHDRNFYDLMNQVAKEADAYDWTKSHGHSVGGSTPLASVPYQASAGAEVLAVQRAVGGNMQTRRNMSANAAAAAAAATRFGKVAQSVQDEVKADSNQLEERMDTIIHSPRTPQHVDNTTGPNAANVSHPELPVDTGEGGPADVAEDVIMTDIADRAAPQDPTGKETSSDAVSAAPEIPLENPMHKTVKLLQSMGFAENAAKQALSACSNDPDRAVNWITSRHQPAAAAPLAQSSLGQAPLAQTETTPNAVGVPEESVHMLISMGFSAAAAAQALRSHPDDLEAAVNWIVSRKLS
eukprot:Plantae.Rhodophyta-Purpureofilum_apyrenoidigerum.ctg25645.p1 GENE.Plantae.Rhodophyta-Purpureofilum_apyrenoidigerum.ctg25645~~Plantae.Rhodophyta-Purpureofilum_apyrenoidigerum.ctg25645.p1  ORF type:complete len:516 (+),score=91.93 Plantae.Rhodophyta-Purpureofilum_apyrenoidigerum.ctg25645:128-1675(+)